MSKSEYTNLFSIATNSISQETVLKFYNSTPIFNEKHEITGEKIEEIITLAMTTPNIEELYKVIGKLLYDRANTNIASQTEQ